MNGKNVSKDVLLHTTTGGESAAEDAADYGQIAKQETESIYFVFDIS